MSEAVDRAGVPGSAGAAADPHDELVVRVCAGRDAPCPACGYNLRDVGGARCPECGVKLRLHLYPVAQMSGAYVLGAAGLGLGMVLGAVGTLAALLIMAPLGLLLAAPLGLACGGLGVSALVRLVLWEARWERRMNRAPERRWRMAWAGWVEAATVVAILGGLIARRYP